MEIEAIIGELSPTFEVEVTWYDAGSEGNYIDPPENPEIEFDILGWDKNFHTSRENDLIKKAVDSGDAHEIIMDAVFIKCENWLDGCKESAAISKYEKWLDDCEESAAISNYEN